MTLYDAYLSEVDHLHADLGSITVEHTQASQVRLGIGVITYDRKDVALETIRAVRQYTTTPMSLVVADDGSPEETIAALSCEAPVIVGGNRGVAWNKNRALFHLTVVENCNVVILLEDDTRPVEAGWEIPWIEAARLWGHANWAGTWFKSHMLEGAGTPADPYLSHQFSAQCAVFSGEAIGYIGYFDPRFIGYGCEHVDHTMRLARGGYGGGYREAFGHIYYLIDSNLHLEAVESSENADQVGHNAELWHRIQDEPIHRMPWIDDDGMNAFREEIRSIRKA